LKIGNDGIERLALQSGQSFFAIVCGAAEKSGRAQNKGKKLASSGFVVHGKNARGGPAVRKKFGEGAPGFRGKRLIS
jgi:hypothetical protein